MSRWISFLIVILIGAGLGLAYGWLVDPVDYVDTAPDTLRIDYKTDYVLMVAETFHQDQDVVQAVRRLALLGGASPQEVVGQSIEFARQAGYLQSDLAILQELLEYLQLLPAIPETPAP